MLQAFRNFLTEGPTQSKKQSYNVFFSFENFKQYEKAEDSRKDANRPHEFYVP